MTGVQTCALPIFDPSVLRVLRHLVVLHEVDHVDRAVFGWGAGGEKEAVVLIYGAVLVFQSWCVRHIAPSGSWGERTDCCASAS